MKTRQHQRTKTTQGTVVHTRVEPVPVSLPSLRRAKQKSNKGNSKKEEPPTDAGDKESYVQPGDDGSNKEEPPIDGGDDGGDNGSNNDELPGNGGGEPPKDDNTADADANAADDDEDEDDNEKEPANDDGIDGKLKSERKNIVADKLLLIRKRHQRSKDKAKLGKEVDNADEEDPTDLDANADAKEQPDDDANVADVAEKLELIRKRHQHSKARLGKEVAVFTQICCYETNSR
jgi:hypothetical protein